jgi:antitoxin VapB
LKRTAKVFWSGNSQAVRIPKEFLIAAEEVEIRRRGQTIVLTPKMRTWKPLLDSLARFTEDFLDDRDQPALEKRSETLR